MAAKVRAKRGAARGIFINSAGNTSGVNPTKRVVGAKVAPNCSVGERRVRKFNLTFERGVASLLRTHGRSYHFLASGLDGEAASMHGVRA